MLARKGVNEMATTREPVEIFHGRIMPSDEGMTIEISRLCGFVRHGECGDTYSFMRNGTEVIIFDIGKVRQNGDVFALSPRGVAEAFRQKTEKESARLKSEVAAIERFSALVNATEKTRR